MALVLVAACREGTPDDGDVADSATGSSGAPVVEVTLYHCGVDPISFDGTTWEVPEETGPFDATNAPEAFVGRGTIELAPEGGSLRYVDESGVTLVFVPDDGVDPGCA